MPPRLEQEQRLEVAREPGEVLERARRGEHRDPIVAVRERHAGGGGDRGDRRDAGDHLDAHAEPGRGVEQVEEGAVEERIALGDERDVPPRREPGVDGARGSPARRAGWRGRGSSGR